MQHAAYNSSNILCKSLAIHRTFLSLGSTSECAYFFQLVTGACWQLPIHMGSWDYEVELGPKTGAMHILHCHNTAHAEIYTLIYCTIVLFSLTWHSFVCAFSNK